MKFVKSKVTVLALALGVSVLVISLHKPDADSTSNLPTVLDEVGLKTVPPASDLAVDLGVEAEQVEASLRSEESYAVEFSSAPEATLRLEVRAVDRSIEPAVQASNKRALTIDERMQIANGLRKRQAILKILIDRQIDASNERIQL